MFEYLYFGAFQIMLTLRQLFRWRRYLNYNPLLGFNDDLSFQIVMISYVLYITTFIILSYPITGAFPEFIYKHLYGYMTRRYIT